MSTALVVGATGAIGTAVATHLTAQGFEVLGTSRHPGGADLTLDPAQPESDRRRALGSLPALAVVVFAQGTNTNDALGALDLEQTTEVLDGNLTLVIDTLDALVQHERLQPGARVVIVSSVWEQIARAGKFSYTVSKAALGGVVRAAAMDLAARGVLVNAVLPGVVDTPMTRAVLSEAQLDAVRASTGFGRLVDIEAVASTVAFFCSAANTATTGQSVAVDLGFSVARPL